MVNVEGNSKCGINYFEVFELILVRMISIFIE